MDTDFISALRAYAQDDGENPVMTVTSAGLDDIVREISVFFDGPVLKDILSRPLEFKKELTVVACYGYQGRSQGGQNGICRLKDSDSVMHEKLENFQNGSGADLLKAYSIADPEYVKIVVHKPNGKRVVGFYDKDRGVMLFTHQLAYKK